METIVNFCKRTPTLNKSKTNDDSANKAKDEAKQLTDEVVEEDMKKKSLPYKERALDDDTMDGLAFFLQRNATLTKVDLSNNVIGDEGMQFLSRAFNVNTVVKTLNLNGNKIGDKGAEYCSDSLKQNSSLTSLDLSDNDIKIKGAQSIAEALEKNSTLVTIKLKTEINLLELDNEKGKE